MIRLGTLGGLGSLVTGRSVAPVTPEAPAPPVGAAPDDPTLRPRPRDTQRSRVYRAESAVPSSPLPGLPACASFADRVVGSLWWTARFPDHTLAGVPRLRPGNGARQAFYREDPDGPTITLPRRYRTKGVVLHELVHWALRADDDLANHGPTFTRILLDATAEFCGPERADLLAAAYAEQRVKVGPAPAPGPDGGLVYGADERARQSSRRISAG